MIVTIEGYEMPGRTAGADGRYRNVHVGVQRRADVVDRVPGDAPDARWSVEVTPRIADDGTVDFGGPYVHGRRGDRFVYLSWGTVDEEEPCTFGMFRRAKLHFADCDTADLASALAHGELVCRVRMTDSCGEPRCAHVRAPDAVWSART